MEPKENRTTEEAILEAAEAEFIEKGFDQARTVSIAQRAGVTHAMLHYYFRTKEQLFDKILDRKIGLIEEIITSLFAEPDLPLKERLTQVISRHFDLLVANPGLPRFLNASWPRFCLPLSPFKKKSTWMPRNSCWTFFRRTCSRSWWARPWNSPAWHREEWILCWNRSSRKISPSSSSD